jgi:hypothetical protein
MILGLSVGRVVHYVVAEGEGHVGGHRKADIAGVPAGETENETGTATLLVIPYPRDDSRVDAYFIDALYSESAEPGTWHWPERV